MKAAVGSMFSDKQWGQLIDELRFSPRQTQVLKHIFDGLGDKQIALGLGIAVPTLRSHLERCFAKCGVHGRTALILHVLARVTPAGRDPMFSNAEWTRVSEHLDLSPRQTDILRLLFKDRDDKAISRELKISVSTLRTHMARLFDKLDVQDRNELILSVFRDFLESGRQGGRPCANLLRGRLSSLATTSELPTHTSNDIGITDPH